MSRFIIIFSLLLLFPLLFSSYSGSEAGLFAQEPKGFQGGLNFSLGFPQGDFADIIDRTGFGGGLDFFFMPVRTPYGIGLSANYLSYGQETREEPFSTTIPDVTVDVQTSNNLLQFYLAGRLQAKHGFFQPYLEGLVGFNYLWTSTKIKNQGNFGEEVSSSTNFDDFAFSYGGGGGTLIHLWEGSTSGDDGKRHFLRVMLDLRVRYTVGGEAEYLKEGSITRENGRVTYDVSRSETDIITAHIGAVIQF